MFRYEVVVYVALALAAGGVARSPKNNLVQNLNDKPSVVMAPVARSIKFNNEIEDDQSMVVDEVPVNERFPSAVLFGRTCGGTILSEKWVLSAGHCTLFTGGREVLAGTNNTGDGSGVRRRVKNLYLHHNFSVGPYWLDAVQFNFTQVAARWDFLLAELETPLPLNNRTIKAAGLDGRDNIPAGEPVGYGGFGAKNHGETMRHNMHGMDLMTLSDTECSSLEQYNPQDMLCVRGRPPRQDSACNGDSGSGLVDVNNNLLGVASWVENDALTCFNGAKVVFAKVSAALPWIKKITGL